LQCTSGLLVLCRSGGSKSIRCRPARSVVPSGQVPSSGASNSVAGTLATHREASAIVGLVVWSHARMCRCRCVDCTKRFARPLTIQSVINEENAVSLRLLPLQKGSPVLHDRVQSDVDPGRRTKVA